MKNFFFFILKTLFAVALIVFLIRRTDLRLSDVAALSIPLLLFAFGALLVQIVLTAIRWFVFLRAADCKIPFLESLSLSMQGVFFTLFIPAGAVSGDIMKAALLARRLEGIGRFHAVFSIVTDRFAGLSGLFLGTLVFGLFRWRAIGNMPTDFRIGFLVVIGFCAMGLLAITALCFHDVLLRIRPIRLVWDRMDGISRGTLGKISGAVALYRTQWPLFLLWTCLSAFLLFPMLATCYFLLALAICPNDVPHFSDMLLMSNTAQVAGMIPLTPGGIGLRDTAGAAALVVFGVSKPDAALIPIVYTLLQISAGLLGGLFFLFDFRGRKKAPAHDMP